MAYLAMEFVEGGRPLEAYVRERALDAAGRVALVVQVCDALEAAHDVGVIHRDLKPDNLLVTPDGQVKVVDLGLARESDASDLTQSGDVLGTVNYMAPEQVKGQAKRADARTDVFALGTILFELIAGELPFRGNSVAEILRAILLKPPPDLRQLAPRAPPGLHRVVERALAKAPADRYAQVADMRHDLIALLEPSHEPPPRRLSAIALGSLLLLAGVLVAATRSSQRVQSLGSQPTVEHTAPPQSLQPAPDPQAVLLAAGELLDAWPPRAGSELEQALDVIGPADSGLAHRLRGRLLDRLERPAEAIDAFSAAIASDPTAEDYYRRGLLERSSRDLGRALELGLPDGEAKHAHALREYLVLDLDEAERLARQAITNRFERPPSPASRRLEVRAWRLLADIRSARKDAQAAEAYRERVAEILREDAPAMIARARRAYGRAGRAYRETPDDADALALLPTFEEANVDAARALEYLPDSTEARWIRLEVANYTGRITARTGTDPRPHLKHARDDATWLSENADDARALFFRGLFEQYVYDYERGAGGDTLTPLNASISDLQASVARAEDMDALSVLAHLLLRRAQLKLRSDLPNEEDYRSLLEVTTVLIERGGEIYSRTNGDAYLYRGVATLELEGRGAALDDLAEAIRLDPANGNGLPADLLTAVQERQQGR
jgi:tetratricopeptide (TPR) repeat protein